jgi:hypothetical protein
VLVTTPLACLLALFACSPLRVLDDEDIIGGDGDAHIVWRDLDDYFGSTQDDGQPTGTQPSEVANQSQKPSDETDK